MSKVKSQSLLKNVYVTASGLVETQAELSALKTTRRQEVAERIERARELGSVEENSEYDAALEEQALVENRIAYLEEMLSEAKVIKKEAVSDFVVIGSTIKVDMDGKIDEFTLVGKLEANPLKKKISNESPVGAALLGAKIGEEVEVTTPIVRYKLKILNIS